MTDTTTDSPADEAELANQPISKKVERVDEIIDILEDGDVSLERAKDLRDEAHTLIESLETDMDLGDASVLEQ